MVSKVIDNVAFNTSPDNEDKKSWAIKLATLWLRYRMVFVSLAGMLLLGTAGVLWSKHRDAKHEDEVRDMLWIAEMHSMKGEYNKALKGDGVGMGFLEVIEKYGDTRSGNLARFRAASIYVKKDKYEEAIELLKTYIAKAPQDMIVFPRAHALMGDAYCQQTKYEEAVEWYKKAWEHQPNAFFTPEYLTKLGDVYEKLEDYAKARDCYITIRDDYPKSAEVAWASSRLGHLGVIMARTKT